MIGYTLNIGDVVTSSKPSHYTCFGLGSCIGLFIQDRVTGISGGAHILLPQEEEGPESETKFYNVSTALEEILKQFKMQGSNLSTLRAKVTGGANVINVNTKTGSRNSESVIRQLTERKIFIAAVDVGGNYCRTAKFTSDTGELLVRIPQTNEHKIY